MTRRGSHRDYIEVYLCGDFALFVTASNWLVPEHWNQEGEASKVPAACWASQIGLASCRRQQRNNCILLRAGGVCSAWLVSCGLARQGALWSAALYAGWLPAGPTLGLWLQPCKPTAAWSSKQVGSCSEHLHKLGSPARRQQQNGSAHQVSQSCPADLPLASQHQRHRVCGSCGGPWSTDGGLPVQRREVLHVQR